MEIRVVGIHHKTAPIEIREKFFCTPLQQELILSELKSHPSVIEAIILSTCNRTEIYANTLGGAEDSELLINLLFQVKNLEPTAELQKYFYTHTGKNAVAYFLSVTSGLESLVLGEKQILGQVKEAVALSRKKAMLGKHFNILSNIAIRTGKKAQHETSISHGGASLSWAAVSMAEKVLGSLKDKSVLIIGAGKMGELAGDQIANKGVKELFVMNRTESCALELASRISGEAVSFGDIKEILSRVDVCICSVGAPHYILDKSTVEKIMLSRPEREIVLIDISMPRNIDPEVAQVIGASLFVIDDLDRVVNDNMRKRQSAVKDVQAIIASGIVHYEEKIFKLTQYSPTEFTA